MTQRFLRITTPGGIAWHKVTDLAYLRRVRAERVEPIRQPDWQFALTDNDQPPSQGAPEL